jgi:hypothetical protein
MRGIYTVAFDQASFTAANGDHDFFELRPAVGKPIEIVAIFIGNKSEVGDVQEEMVAWSIERFTGATFTSGTGGATPTPRLVSPGDGAASFGADSNNTAIATTSGTKVQLHIDTFNIRVGLQIIFPPDMRHKSGAVDAHDALVVRMLTALADDATLSGSIYVRELI